MATPRQITANQKNAQKSSGPKTEEGKDASRRNSVKHGLAGSGMLLPGDDEAAIEKRKAQWRPHFLINNPESEWFFDQMVVNAVRLDRCRQEEAKIRLNESQHAAISWDDDRHDEAAEIAAKLAKHPVNLSRRLERTPQGADWMIKQWNSLIETIEGGGQWTEAQTSLAHDLIGTPLELRDLVEPIHHPAALAAQEMAHLLRRKETALLDHDDFERDAAQRGLPIQPSRAIANLRRYEATCMRTYLWASNLLEPTRQTPPEPQPTPPDPEPQDDPDCVEDSIEGQEPVETIQDVPTFRLPERASLPANRRARRAAAAKQARRRSA